MHFSDSSVVFVYGGETPPISRAKMMSVTKSAIKAIKLYKHVVQIVERFIKKCKPELKIPGLYVIDSIVRQSRHQFGIEKDVFGPRFLKNFTETFVNICQCPEDDKVKIMRVLNLWQKNGVFDMDIIQPLMDMANGLSISPRRRRRSRSSSLSRRSRHRRSRSRERRSRERRSRSRERRRRTRSRSQGRGDREDREKDREKDRERQLKGLPSMKNQTLSVCTTTLWVGQLDKKTQQADVMSLLEEFGPIESINMIPPRGCAYIVMLHRPDAYTALNRLSRGPSKVNLKPVKIAWALNKGIKAAHKKFWDVERGVTYIPWSKVKAEELHSYVQGGMLDIETLNPGKEKFLFALCPFTVHLLHVIKHLSNSRAKSDPLEQGCAMLRSRSTSRSRRHFVSSVHVGCKTS
uniref:SR-related CTD-associated factor 4b n=1 Tax=Gouania willdenowi TaxID=441366 RepID=A0A8C5E5S9_GOUWI